VLFVGPVYLQIMLQELVGDRASPPVALAIIRRVVVLQGCVSAASNTHDIHVSGMAAKLVAAYEFMFLQLFDAA
jgi:hypothetical protein